MNRPICVLTIICIAIIIVLHLNGVAFLNFDKVYKSIANEKEYEGIIISKEEKDYKYVYIIKIESKNKLLNEKKFILNLKKNNKINLNYGDKISFKGKYKKPSGKRNYGGYDYSLYLKTRNIYGTFEECNVKIISRNSINKLQMYMQNCKDYIKNCLNNNLEEDEASLCIGLILGDKENLSEEIQENFKTASLTHILAVSGAHFTYVVLMITYFNRILKRKILGQILMIILIVIFMNITGNTASVVRAGVMSIMMILASLLHRESDSWNNIAISSLIQIINNPYIIFDIGFQLSYGGVIGILIFNKHINNILITAKQKILNESEGKIANYIIQTVSLSLSANIVITPIMMINFNTLSFSFIISNILVSPFLGLIIILSFILIILSLILGKIIIPFFHILNFILFFLIKISEFCASLPLSKIYVITPNICLLILFYIILSINIKLKRSKRLMICLIIVILLNFTIPVVTSNRSNIEINFIDVGQGDSCLIRTSNKKILIDGGGNMYSESFDVGEKILLPYLLDRGICSLDYILVSHFDADHFQGLMYVIENMKVKNIILSNVGQESSEYYEFLKLAKSKKINIIYVKNGDMIKIAEMKIEILYPDNEKIVENAKNNNAIVCKVIYENISMLFTGDIEKEAEEKILNMYGKEKLESTILKVAHHGSKTSSTLEFVNAVNPKVALIGVGENNKFGHPNDEVLERLNKIRK